MTQLSLTAPAAPRVPGIVMWCGLNPSIAVDGTGGKADDPTIRREQGFLRHWGVALDEPRIGYRGDRTGAQGTHRFVLTRPGMIKVNLFSVRATKPEWMLDAPVPNHRDNDRAILDAANEAKTIIVAWGGPHGGKRLQRMIDERARHVVGLLARYDKPLMCLGVSSSGAPRHPLMLAYATKLEVWRTP